MDAAVAASRPVAADARLAAGPLPSAGSLDVAVAVEPGFDFLSDEYRALFAQSRATAFQSPLWMDAVHRDLVPPLGAAPHTLTVRQAGGGRLLTVIALVLQKSRGVALLQPADFGVCDYNAAVAAPWLLEALAADETVRRRIDALLEPAGLLIFRKVRSDGFDMKRLFVSPAETLGENAAYHSVLGEDFEEWRRHTLRKKFSKELNRLARQLERDAGPYEHREARGEAEIREAFDAARRMREGRFAGDLFADETYFRFYVNVAVAGAGTGETVTFVSYLKGKPVAVLFGPSGDGVFHAVMTASDTGELAKFSPGLQILYQMIRQRFEAGHRRFDMGLGNSGYKTHFRVEETPMHNFTVSRTVAGKVVSLVYNHAKPVKNVLKRFVPQVR